MATTHPDCAGGRRSVGYQTNRVTPAQCGIIFDIQASIDRTLKKVHDIKHK